MLNIVGWFFFDLILLGYVEDPITGLSVTIPGGMDWKIYVEVPSQINMDDPEASLKQFIEDVPALGMLGAPYIINSSTPYTVDEDVQLVCKYLRAYYSTEIDRLYTELRESFCPEHFAFYTYVTVQWNLLIRDSFVQRVLSLTQRLSLIGRFFKNSRIMTSNHH